MPLFHERSAHEDPLVGMQRITDSPEEAMRTPHDEVSLEPMPVGLAIKSRRLAGFLAIMLGWLGVHRFYLGFYRIGLLQAALSVGAITMVFAVGWWLTPEPLWWNMLLTAAGAVAVFVLWGIFEGVAILFGQLHYDAQLHPLRP